MVGISKQASVGLDQAGEAIERPWLLGEILPEVLDRYGLADDRRELRRNVSAAAPSPPNLVVLQIVGIPLLSGLPTP